MNGKSTNTNVLGAYFGIILTKLIKITSGKEFNYKNEDFVFFISIKL